MEGRGDGSASLSVLEKNELTHTVIPRGLPSGAPPGATGKAKGCGWGDKSGLALPPTSRRALAGPETSLGVRSFLCKLGEVTAPSRGCWEASRRSGR